jgi:hypothetical protein
MRVRFSRENEAFVWKRAKVAVADQWHADFSEFAYGQGGRGLDSASSGSKIFISWSEGDNRNEYEERQEQLEAKQEGDFLRAACLRENQGAASTGANG